MLIAWRGNVFIGILAAAVLAALAALSWEPEPELASGTPMKIGRLNPGWP